MTNYRVRQVLALGVMPDRQLRLLIALATWLPDDTRTVRVGFDTLIRDTGNVRNTVRKARRELEGAGQLSSIAGDGRGLLTLWTVLCLPEKGVNASAPLPVKGVNIADPLLDVKGVNIADPLLDPLPGGVKGVNPVAERGSSDPEKGGQGQRADLQKPVHWLNSRAKPLGQEHSRVALDPYDAPGFAEFWSVYPSKKAKRQAAKAYRPALSRCADTALIIKAAAAYRDDPSRDPAYTKNPATWLNGDCWNDETEPRTTRTDRRVTAAREAGRRVGALLNGGQS